MSLFTDLCRESGSILHHLLAPVKQELRRPEGQAEGHRVETVHREVRVETEQVNEKVILRRTTIEEIELQKTAR